MFSQTALVLVLLLVVSTGCSDSSSGSAATAPTAPSEGAATGEVLHSFDVQTGGILTGGEIAFDRASGDAVGTLHVSVRVASAGTYEGGQPPEAHFPFRVQGANVVVLGQQITPTVLSAPERLPITNGEIAPVVLQFRISNPALGESCGGTMDVSAAVDYGLGELVSPRPLTTGTDVTVGGRIDTNSAGTGFLPVHCQ